MLCSRSTSWTLSHLSFVASLPLPLLHTSSSTSASNGHRPPSSRLSTNRGEIQSVHNKRIKEARALLQRRHREKQGRILLEGQRLIADALKHGVAPLQVFYTTEAVDRNYKIEQLCRLATTKAGAEGFVVSEDVIQSLSDTVTPQGVVAVCERPAQHLPDGATLALICDGVQDPGNVGTLLRSAAAAGADVVAFSRGCADIWGLKALRSGMGAQFAVAVSDGLSWNDLETWTRRNDLHVRAAALAEENDRDVGKSLDYSQVDWKTPSAIVIGSEATGVSEDALKIAKDCVHIPMARDVESLNAAMAGTVILFEARRQRSKVGQ